MQQSSSQQLKCYGRRNRSKPVPSTLDCGPPLGKDVVGATHIEEPHIAIRNAEEVESSHLATPQRGRPKKVIVTPKEGDRASNDVVGKNMPTTRRKSAGRTVEASEATRDALTFEESVSEGSSLRTPVKPTDEETASVEVEGTHSNGASELGRKKTVVFGSTGSRKTRAQLAKEEAQKAAAGDDCGGGGEPPTDRAGGHQPKYDRDGEDQPKQDRDGGHQPKHDRDGEDQPKQDRGSGQQPKHDRDGGNQPKRDIDSGHTEKKNNGQPQSEKQSAGKGNREKKDGGHSTGERQSAAAPISFAAHRRLLALQRRQKEDLVLSQADDIFLKREFLEANKDKKSQPKSKEPARSKTHWDFVIEEMTWLAKDFERERKWKLSQAKKVAIRVSRSKLDVEAREIRRLKEEDQRMRRVASNISKEVKKFWLKVDKLVSYKQQLQVEERKKKALDKHLDFLLGQTERYSTMLAENLADNSTALEHQNTLLLPPVSQDNLEGVGRELAVVLQTETVPTFEELPNLKIDVRFEAEGGDEDFMLEDEEEQDDDEATLEADEALITEDERKEELSALQRESELPLEDILNFYKSSKGMTDSEEEEEDDESGGTDSEELISEEEELGKEFSEMNTSKDTVTVVSHTDVIAHHSIPEKLVVGAPEEISKEGLSIIGTAQSGSFQERDIDDSNAEAVSETLDGQGQSKAEDMLKVHVVMPDTILVGSELDNSKNPALGKVEAADEVGGAGDGPVIVSEEAVERSSEEELVAVLKGGKSESQYSKDAVNAEKGALKQTGGLTTLVVELTDRNLEPEGVSFSSIESLRQRHPLGSNYLDLGLAREIQDDRDYIPAALADGNDEDDDERTLEEEEDLARGEGEGSIDEIDQLKLESEMPIEELIAKYRSGATDDGGDASESLEDRRDRTSEAGTSGSSSDEEYDEDDYEMARDMAEAKERMGEPSTSGRDHPPLSTTGNGKIKNIHQVIDNLEVKQEIVESIVQSTTPEEFQKVSLKPAAVNAWRKNGVLGAASSGNNLSSTSLLLEVDEDDDVETVAAVAKVTEAARRRGERIVLRAFKEDTDDFLGNGIGGTVSQRVGAAIESSSHDENDAKYMSSSHDSPEGSEGVGHLLSLPSSDVINIDDRLADENLVTVDHEVDGLSGVPGNLVQKPEVDRLERGKEVLTTNSADLGEEKITELERHGSAELQNQGDGGGKSSEDTLADFAAAAQSAQPTGYTFSTTKVKTKLPFLLKHSLREYQHIGLDWLVTMYEKRLNGILADEMGLGKTIMTIALLAHLACEKGIWGPHLIVVPTSVMLNWETEFMKWCPAFKILTYFGNAKERKLKRQGWSRPNSFHVCITTYRLVIQDAKAFRRKKWKYLILDEAHLIKNWKSQRWQTLLNFNSKRRILLTGTPLQNDLMELWSLMHFLMPHVFQSHQEFRDWFSNPITGMVEGVEQVNKELVDRLHNVLRPFLLRRLKKDVEKQLPGKFEHVVRCRLSKRQRNLYEDFMASSDTQATLSSGNFLGLINVLMQLRKVCNHPDLFEGRPIISSFDMPGIEVHLSSAACSAKFMGPFGQVDLESLNLRFSQLDGNMTKWEAEEVATMKTPVPMIVELASTGEDTWTQQQSKHKPSKEVRGVIEELQSILKKKREKQRKDSVLAMCYLNELRCSQQPVYGADILKLVEATHPVYDVHKMQANPSQYLEFSSLIADIVQLPLTRCENMMDLIAAFVFAIPAARAPLPVAWCSHLLPAGSVLKPSVSEEVSQIASSLLVPLRPVVVRRQLFFPDRRLLQFDCGKLQELAVLLRRLKSEGHRALIFTQMTKMLDVLESFINLYGYTYMRLDGSTKPEQRQILMQRFNTNPKIFLFILSTRSGGVGINLVGADTVIFYDSDWNPAMDQQAQDRCHRIGQTREVHIYRLVSESTIEENILKKANQKRILDDLVIQSGSYNTEFFKKLDPMELFSGLKGVKVDGSSNKFPGAVPVVASTAMDIPGSSSVRISEQNELSNAEVEAALRNAEDEADYMAMKRVEQEEAAENQEFTEEVYAGNLDDEDLADDLDEGGRVGKAQTEVVGMAGLPKVDHGLDDGGVGVGTEDTPFGESSMIPADADEEMDMLADVRQMAAAAAASGKGSTSFEDQLRPVERYAMRFLELWDPRVDKLAVVAQVAFEEKEWELDQLEKLKEEQEAEIDEDNEPLFYETWDTALADEAYRQQVDILAQQQENQKQLEWEAMEEEMRDADRAVAEAAEAVVGAEYFSLKSKGKKKSKRAKFKSLAEGSLMSDTDDTSVGEDYHPEGSRDPTYRDSHSDMLPLPHRNPSQRKRKAPKLLEEEMMVEMHSKKFKKDQFGKDRVVTTEKDKGKKRSADGNAFRTLPGEANDHDQSGTMNEVGTGSRGSGHSRMGGLISNSGKNKGGGKITIMGMHPKKGPLVMLEKERKKDFSRSQDHLPQASPWKHGEDAVLCAVVHEYGGNWQLASDALAGIPAGGVYRGRHRHPIHCRERFRQLLAQNAAAASGNPTSEKSALNAATNAQLKVTEEHTKRLLDAVLQLPDDELLLQRHFMAVLTAFQNWKKFGTQKASEKLPVPTGVNFPRARSFIPLQSLVLSHSLSTNSEKVKLSPREVMAALAQVQKEPKAATNQVSRQPAPNKDQGPKEENESFSVIQFLAGSLEYTKSSEVEGEKTVPVQSLPSPVSLEDLLGLHTLSLPVPPPTSKAVRHLADTLVENRYRLATRISWDGDSREWAAAGGSGTGVLGVHIPTKGKGVAKKRPASDPSKPPKSKQPKVPKVSTKKVGGGDGKSGEPSSTVVTSGGATNNRVAQNGEIHGVAISSSRLPDSPGASTAEAPITSKKSGASRFLKNSTSPSTQFPPRGLDLNLQQPEAHQLEGSTKVIISKKAKMSAAGPVVQGVTTSPLNTENKIRKKGVTQFGQAKTTESAVVAAKAGSGNLLGSPLTGQAVGSGSNRKELLGERGIDLNDSSDDDLTIIGASPAVSGSRMDLPISRLAVSLGRSEIASHVAGSDTVGPRKLNSEVLGGSIDLNHSGLSQRIMAASSIGKTIQSPGRLGTFLSSGSPASHRGGSKDVSFGVPGHEGSSPASHFVNGPEWQSLSGSPAREHLLLSSVLPEELAQVQWPPGPGGWPAPSIQDLDRSAENMKRLVDDMVKRPLNTATLSDLPPFSFYRGKHSHEGLTSHHESPPRQEARQGFGIMPSAMLSGLQTSDGEIRRSSSSFEDQRQQQADVRERQQQSGMTGLASNSHPQGHGQPLWTSSVPAGNSPHGVSAMRHAVGYAPTGSPLRPGGTGSVPLQQIHSRAHTSPAPLHFRPSSPNTQMYNQAAFSGISLQSFAGSESPVDPDLGLSLGPGMPKKHPGDRQQHTS